MNLHLYEGKGKRIDERNHTLPEYRPLIDIDDPKNYIAERGLRDAVNVALALGQPLLVTGEPGTGKTQLAASIAYELNVPLLKFYTKTTSTATDLFYQYDALGRFHAANFSKDKIPNIEEYISYKALGLAILLSLPPDEVNDLLPKNLREKKRPTRSVVLIDEIDKAPRDFPNDILNEIEQMEFAIKETRRPPFKAQQEYRPILVLTSNSEKNLPEAFLRRCIFYHIEFPSKQQLKAIIEKRFGDHSIFTPNFIKGAVNHFFDIRNLTMLKKRPATAEFLAWIQVLTSIDIDVSNPSSKHIDALALSYSILAKNQEDLKLLKEDFLDKYKEKIRQAAPNKTIADDSSHGTKES